MPLRVLILASCLVQLPQEDAIDGTGAGAFSGSQKRVKVVTIGDVRHELAFAIASRTFADASSYDLCWRGKRIIVSLTWTQKGKSSNVL